MPGGKVEIVVDAQAPFDEFVAGLEPRIREALEGSLDRPATGLPGIGRGSGLR
jgi:hypothetical protein